MRACPSIDRCSCGTLVLASTASFVGTESTVVTAAAVGRRAVAFLTAPRDDDTELGGSLQWSKPCA